MLIRRTRPDDLLNEASAVARRLGRLATTAYGTTKRRLRGGAIARAKSVIGAELEDFFEQRSLRLGLGLASDRRVWQRIGCSVRPALRCRVVETTVTEQRDLCICIG